MLTRNKKLKDYGIPAEDIEKLNTMLKDFPAEYGYLLSSAALSAYRSPFYSSGWCLLYSMASIITPHAPTLSPINIPHNNAIMVSPPYMVLEVASRQ